MIPIDFKLWQQKFMYKLRELEKRIEALEREVKNGQQKKPKDQGQ